jgi:uncharacterized membrane protein
MMLPGWVYELRWRTALVALVCGGIVHIVATLMVPQLAAGSAYQRLAAGLPANSMKVLPPVTQEAQPLPFMSPDTRYAVCRFDVRNGPVAIRALLPDKGWSLALFSPDGGNFYAVPAQDLRRIEVNFVLLPPGERPPGFFGFGRTAASSATEVIAPQAEGLVVVRAASRGQSYGGEVEAQLGYASCEPARP